MSTGPRRQNGTSSSDPARFTRCPRDAPARRAAWRGASVVHDGQGDEERDGDRRPPQQDMAPANEHPPPRPTMLGLRIVANAAVHVAGRTPAFLQLGSANGTARAAPKRHVAGRVVAISLSCRCHAAAMPLPCCCRVDATTLPCRCDVPPMYPPCAARPTPPAPRRPRSPQPLRAARLHSAINDAARCPAPWPHRLSATAPAPRAPSPQSPMLAPLVTQSVLQRVPSRRGHVGPADGAVRRFARQVEPSGPQPPRCRTLDLIPLMQRSWWEWG